MSTLGSAAASQQFSSPVAAFGHKRMENLTITNGRGIDLSGRFFASKVKNFRTILALCHEYQRVRNCCFCVSIVRFNKVTATSFDAYRPVFSCFNLHCALYNHYLYPFRMCMRGNFHTCGHSKKR